MWIRSLKIRNIRSIESADINLSKRINILVGPNNAGKSTILLPLLSLQEGLPSLKTGDRRIGKQDARVHVKIEDLETSLIRPSVQTLEELYFEFVTNQGFVLKGTGNGNSNTINFDRIRQREPDNFVYPFISKRKVIALHERVTDETVEAVPSTFENLNAKIDRLSNPGFQPAHDLYRRACSDILGFEIFTAHTSEGKRAVYTVRNMINIPLLSMGEGVANILGLIVHLAIAENRLFLIEEPENDVHPKALKGLLRLIEEKSENNQFIITTHSNIVLKGLGAGSEAKVFEVVPKFVDRLPTTEVIEVAPIPDERRRVLESLGYEMNDADIWQGWLLLEESSAEKIIREHLIPWFVPELATRLRTYSAHSLSEVTPRFKEFNELFVFLHLEPAYKNRSWILVDGGEQEKLIIDRLKTTYTRTGWKKEQFCQLSEHDFEQYYPESFKADIEAVLGLPDKALKREGKRELLRKVEAWIQQDSGIAKEAFAKSANEVVVFLKIIAEALNLSGSR